MRKCTCPKNKGGQSCSNCSRYKLVFLLRPGYHEKTPSGENINPVWWSMKKEEGKPLDVLYKYMLGRALKSKWASKFYMLQFWERGASVPLYTYSR